MRRLAFSTLGCPGDPVERVVALAHRTGCTGVELRCTEGEPVTPTTPARVLREVRDRCGDIEIVCVASYVEVARADDDPVTDLMRHVEIAEQLGSPYVRVFGGGLHQRAVETLSEAAAR